ncbi:uncharacterized protein LOC144908549 [Branchiostoma floridae x Branchiostoma belcheri]
MQRNVRNSTRDSGGGGTAWLPRRDAEVWRRTMKDGDFPKSGCPLGFHGKSCAPVCRCQNNAGCNLVTGECYCRSGFTGEFCEETCPEGFYGVNCRYRCHHCHSGTSCDRRTGACYANPSFATSDSNKDLALGAQLTANGALIGGFLLVFVLMIVLVAVIVFFRRKLKEERQRRMESISSVFYQRTTRKKGNEYVTIDNATIQDNSHLLNETPPPLSASSRKSLTVSFRDATADRNVNVLETIAEVDDGGGAACGTIVSSDSCFAGKSSYRNGAISCV